jgi:hypothetical protein
VIRVRMAQENTAVPPSAGSEDAWRNMLEDYELRNVAKFEVAEQGSGNLLGENRGITTLDHLPPPIPGPTRTRKILLYIGLGIAVLDLCIMPIVYYYSLTFGTSLKEQSGR